VRKVVVISSASGNGKTTLGRELAEQLHLPFIELDALVHGPQWTERPDNELRARLEPLLAASTSAARDAFAAGASGRANSRTAT
jgi:adenylate kinase family enzyme